MTACPRGRGSGWLDGGESSPGESPVMKSKSLQVFIIASNDEFLHNCIMLGNPPLIKTLIAILLLVGLLTGCGKPNPPGVSLQDAARQGDLAAIRQHIKAGSTALESVAAPFDQVKGVYELLQALLGPAGLKLDLDQIKATRPVIAEMLR